MTAYETLYKAFFDRIEKDDKFFKYNGVSAEDALLLAKTRALNYLHEAISILRFKCTLDVDIQLDDIGEQINTGDVDLTFDEIYLIASLMYQVYLSRDVTLLKSMINTLTSTDIKLLYAPSNERKTFMDMFKDVQNDNLILIDNYSGRNRDTGKRKIIDYASYDM